MIRNAQYSTCIIMVCLVLSTITPVTAQRIGNYVTYTHAFNVGQHIEVNLDAEGEVSFLNVVTLESELDAGFFIGSDLPAELRISHPEWVEDGSTFGISCNAEGLPNGRVGLDIHARVRFSFIVAGIRFDAISFNKELDLSLTLTTPIGTSISEKIEGKIELGSLTIPVLGIRLATYFGVTASIALEGTLISEFKATSISLQSEFQDWMFWDEENETLSKTLSVRDAQSQEIELSFSQTYLRLDQYSIVIDSIFIELEAAGLTLPHLTIPVPNGFLSSIASGTYLSCENPISSTIRVLGLEAQPMYVPTGEIAIGIVAILIVIVLFSKR